MVEMLKDGLIVVGYDVNCGLAEPWVRLDVGHRGMYIFLYQCSRDRIGLVAITDPMKLAGTVMCGGRRSEALSRS